MTTAPSLVQLIVAIVQHTPLWAWGILALLVVLGLRQAVDHTMTRKRLLVAPLALGAFSLYGAGSMFGAHADVIGVWATALLVVVAGQLLLREPADTRFDADGRVALKGSLWPLLTMLSVFALRYVGKVTLVMHPEAAQLPLFALTLTAAYGALSGVMVARSLRILRSACAPAGRIAAFTA